MPNEAKTQRFCVIGESITSQSCIPRRWVDDPVFAAAHAEALIRKHRCRRLYVVQIVQVVELAEPPIRVSEPDRLNCPPLDVKALVRQGDLPTRQDYPR